MAMAAVLVPYIGLLLLARSYMEAVCRRGYLEEITGLGVANADADSNGSGSGLYAEFCSHGRMDAVKGSGTVCCF